MAALKLPNSGGDSTIPPVTSVPTAVHPSAAVVSNTPSPRPIVGTGASASPVGCGDGSPVHGAAAAAAPPASADDEASMYRNIHGQPFMNLKWKLKNDRCHHHHSSESHTQSAYWIVFQADRACQPFLHLVQVTVLCTLHDSITNFYPSDIDQVAFSCLFPALPTMLSLSSYHKYLSHPSHFIRPSPYISSPSRQSIILLFHLSIVQANRVCSF